MSDTYFGLPSNSQQIHPKGIVDCYQVSNPLKGIIISFRIDAVSDICTFLHPDQIMNLQCAVFSESLYDPSQLTGGQ